MPDPSDIHIEKAPDRALISLRVSRRAADDARRRLGLAARLCVAGQDPQSLWLAPDHWLLVGWRQTASIIIEECDARLSGLLYNAVDQSAGYAVLRIGGSGARELLASGAGLDFRKRSFPKGGCQRTRLAQIAVIVVATGMDEFELYVDRGYEKYLSDWLEDGVVIAQRATRSTL